MNWEAFFQPNTPVVSIPNWNTSKLYIAGWNRKAIWQGSALLPAFKVAARVRKIAWRLTSMMSNSSRITQSSWAFEGFLQRARFTDLRTRAVLIGTPGPAQKITIQLCNSDDAVVAYLKFAESVTGKRRLENEWKILSALPVGVAPKPLAFASVEDGVGLLVSAIRGYPVALTVRPAVDAQNYLEYLPKTQLVRATEHPWLNKLKTANYENHRLLEPLLGREWAIVPQHGDFTPWNLLQAGTSLSSSALIAIDWEYGSMDGFPGADATFHILQVAGLVKRWHPLKAVLHAVEYLTKCPSLRMEANEALSLVRLVAYDAYLTALNDGHLQNESLQRWRKMVWETSLIASTRT